MAHEDFCPTCNKVLPFEEYEGTLSCSSCGRTKTAARMALEVDASVGRRKTTAKWKKGGKYVLIGLVLIYGIIRFNAPVGGGTLGGRAVGMLVLSILFGLLCAVVLGVMYVVAWFRGRDRRR